MLKISMFKILQLVSMLNVVLLESLNISMKQRHQLTVHPSKQIGLLEPMPQQI